MVFIYKIAEQPTFVQEPGPKATLADACEIAVTKKGQVILTIHIRLFIERVQRVNDIPKKR